MDETMENVLSSSRERGGNPSGVGRRRPFDILAATPQSLKAV